MRAGITPWSETELAYLAGFIDGEGSISIFVSSSTSKGKRYARMRLILSAYNTNKEIISWVAWRFGGTSNVVKRNRKKWKQCYVWTTGWQNAATVLQAIVPYLRIKKQHAELFIAVARTSHRGKTDPKVIDFRIAAAKKMSELNRVGAI